VRKNVFELGSSLDSSETWSLQSDEVKKKPKELKALHEHSIVLKKEKRRGKPVTLVGEFFIEETKIKDLCKKFKKTLGTGGTYKDGWMEFQGECGDKIKELVKKEGFRTKN